MSDVKPAASTSAIDGMGNPRAAVAKPAAQVKASPAVVNSSVVNKEDPVVMAARMREIVDTLSKQTQAGNRSVGFSYDQALNIHVITVKSATSGEVVRQIPSEAALRVAHNIEKLKGMFFDNKI